MEIIVQLPHGEYKTVFVEDDDLVICKNAISKELGLFEEDFEMDKLNPQDVTQIHFSKSFIAKRHLESKNLPLCICECLSKYDICLFDLEKLIEAGADVNEVTMYGDFPLNCTNDPDFAELLVRSGADVTFLDFDENTVIHSRDVSLQLLKFYIESGLDPYRKNDFQENALYYIEDPETFEYLLELGLSAKDQDLDKSTALHTCNNIDCAKLLLKYGADPEARNYTNSTPLHTTCNIEIAQLLISEGVDLNARTECENTPLHTASDPQIHRLLVSSGANTRIKNIYGELAHE